MSAEDRRQELRREEDEELRVILARHGVRLDQSEKQLDHHEKLLDALGNSVGHVALIDSRVDDQEKRLDRIENDIASALERVEAKIDALDSDFIPRAEMPALYVPREEHEKRWQLRMQWPAVALAIVMIVSQIVILLRSIH